MKHKLKPHRHPPQPRRSFISHKAEANKSMIIGIIAIIAVVGLGLLLFFSQQFVGKAVSMGEAGQNQAGIFLADNTATVGDKIIVPIKVNIGGKESTGFFFSLEYDSSLLEVNCDSVATEIKKLFTVDGEDFTVMGEPSCVDGKILFGYTALTDGKAVITGEKVIANIEFTAKAAGTAEFKFNSLEIYDLETPEKIALEVKGASVVIGTPIEEAGSLCGDGRIDAGETCDSGIFSYGCDYFSLKGTPVCNNCIANYTICEFSGVGGSCMALAGLENQGIISNCAAGLSCEDGICTPAGAPVKGETDQILIELFPKLITDGISATSVITAVKNDNYNVKITLRPDKELPENHLVVVALEYGGKQKTLFWDTKPKLSADGVEVVSFDHQVLPDASALKVKVLVWGAWPSESGWSDLLPKEEKSYEIK